MNNKDKTVFIALLIFLAIVSRFIPHLPNFTPIAAISILISAYISRKYFIIPIVILFISDLFLGFYDLRLMFTVYISFIIVGLFGYFLREKRNIIRLLTVGFFGSLFFFITTNFVVWITSTWYEKSLSGLLHCYILALPFFRNMLIGDIFYLIVIVFSVEFVLNTKSRYLKFLFSYFKNKLKSVII